MDDLNLYDDLDEFQEQHEKKSKELQDVEDKYAKAIVTIQNLKEDNKGLQKKIKSIELSFQSLLDTARTEIKRKDKEIERLRKEKDDICFRRKFPKRAQDTTDSAATFPQVAKTTSATTKADSLQSKEIEHDYRTWERSSDHFDESHKRHRSRDDRDYHYQKRQRSDREHYKSIDSYRDNKWVPRYIDKERDSYKYDRNQETYSNQERNRNHHERECHTERHKTLRESSGSPVRGGYRQSRSEQYNRRYSPSHGVGHVDKYYNKSRKTSERKERLNRTPLELGENYKSVSYSKSPVRKSSKDLNKISLEPSHQVKEQHSSQAVDQRNEERSHPNVCKDVGRLQHESDVSRTAGNSKLVSSQESFNTNKKLTTSTTNIDCTYEVTVKGNLEIKDSESVKNIVNKQQYNDASAIKRSNKNILNERVTSESQESEETKTHSQFSEIKDILYENIECGPCKDLKQADDKQKLETRTQQVVSNWNNADLTIVSKTNDTQNVVYEILVDDLAENSLNNTIKNANNQEVNDVDLNSLNETNGSDTCQNPRSNEKAVCEIVDIGPAEDAPGCQKPSRNNEVEKPSKENENADNSKIAFTEGNMLLNAQKLCTPRTVALLDSLFGQSPSSASSADSNKNLLTNIMGIVSKSKGIDNDSTTTSPKDYSDCAASSNKDVDRPQNRFDLAEFEKCFIERTDEAVKLISSDDLSGGCVMVVTSSREDSDNNGCSVSCQQKDNTGLANKPGTSPTNTSPGNYSNIGVIAVTPLTEIVDAPQQSCDKTELDNGFPNNADIVLDRGEQETLRTNVTNTTSEDTGSTCFMKPTSSSEVGDAPQLNNNNNDSVECCASVNCGREQVLSNGDNIDLTEEYFGEEVECLEASDLHNTANSINSENNTNSEDGQFTSLNKDVELYESPNKDAEIPVLNCERQLKEPSEESKEGNCDEKSDQSSITNIETQKNHDNILPVTSDEGESGIKLNVISSNDNRLANHSLEAITWGLATLTKEPLPKQIIDDTSVTKAIQTECLSTNTDTKTSPNTITANEASADKNTVAVEIAPDDYLSTLSCNGVGPITLRAKENVSVENDDISPPSVGITDFNKLQNEITEVKNGSVILRHSDILQETVSKESLEKSDTNLFSTYNLNLEMTRSQTYEIVSSEDEDFSVTENLIPKTTSSPDHKAKTHNVFLETITLDLTSPAKEIISKKTNIALLPTEANNEIKDNLLADQFNVSELASQNRILGTIYNTTTEGRDLAVDPADQQSIKHVTGLGISKIQTTLCCKHKEGFDTELNDLECSKEASSTDRKSIDFEAVLTDISSPITKNLKSHTPDSVRDIELSTKGSSRESLSLCQNQRDPHKQHFMSQSITSDQHSPTKEPVAKPSNICGDLHNDTDGIEKITDELISATQMSGSSRPSRLEGKDLTSHEDESRNKKLDIVVFDLQSVPNEHVSNQTKILPSDIGLKDNGTHLKNHNLEQSLSSFTTTAGSRTTKEMIFINSKVSTLKTPSPDCSPPSALNDNIEFLETKDPTEYSNASDLKNKEVVAVESVGNPMIEKSTTLPTVLVKQSLLTTDCFIDLTKDSVPENSKESLGKTCQSKEYKDDEDLYRKTEERETSVNIPGLDLLLPSENFEVNLDTAPKSSSHKNTMWSNNKLCGDAEVVSLANVTDILASQNVKAQLSRDVDAVSIPGLDLLSPDIQQEVAKLNEISVNSTLTKAKHVDARPTSSIPITSEVPTDITVTNINNTSDTIFSEAKESQKYPPSFVSENKIEQECEVNSCKEIAKDPIKFDTVTGEKDISAGENIESKDPFTLTADLNVIKNTESLSRHKIIEEINNNPEKDEFKKDTRNINPLLNKCKHLHKDDRIKIDKQDLVVRELGQNAASEINITGEKCTAEGVREKCIKSPCQFNKPAERMVSKGSPNLNSSARKSIESPRELLDGMSVSKVCATGKEITEMSSSSNFDAIINFERNLSLLDKSTEQFDKDIETMFKPVEKKKESVKHCDTEQISFKNMSDSMDRRKSNAGQSDELREQYPQQGSITQFNTNAKHELVTETFGKQTQNDNTSNVLSENRNLPILSHKVSRILFTSSKINLENTNNIPDLYCEEQAIKSHPSLKQNTETIFVTPPSVQITTSKEFQNSKIINSPSCNHVSQNVNIYQGHKQVSMINNVDIGEIPNISLNPVCTTPKTPRRSISGYISGSLNTLKPSTVSDCYGLPNNLPSISTKCPTPPNFSGIFSKMDSASLDTVKYMKKSPKLKSFVIPAASVLFNVDNLHNATKASKKLHWELLENRNEMTEIEDDSDANSTDEEQQLDKKESEDDNLTHKEVKKLATSHSAITPYKDSKSEGNKSSKMFATLTPNLPKGVKLKKSYIPRRNTIDTVASLTHDTLKQFKQLTITKSTTNVEISANKVIKNQPQTSRRSKILKANLMTSSAVEVKCPEGLMDSELLQATKMKSTKSICKNMSAKAISKPGLNLVANCKKSKNMNAKVEQLVPVQKRKKGRPPKPKIVEQNIEDSAVIERKACISKKTHCNKLKDPDTKCVTFSEKSVTQNTSLKQKDNYSIIKALNKIYQTEEHLGHKSDSIESTPKSTRVNKDVTNVYESSACEESPVEIIVYDTSILWGKVHSSDEQNSSVAENSEPECNKYLKEHGFHPTSKESIASAYQQPPKVSFKPVDKLALRNYKIPKIENQVERTVSSGNKIIHVEDISFNERSIEDNLLTFRIPKSVSNMNEFNKKSCAMETYIHSAECEKTKAVEVQEQRHGNRQLFEDAFERENNKSTETCQRKQTKPEKKTHANKGNHQHISKSRNEEIAEDTPTCASKTIDQTDVKIATKLNNEIVHVSDQDRHKFGNLKPRRKSTCVQISTEENANLSDEDNKSRQIRPRRKSLYLERNFDEDLLVNPQTADGYKKSSYNKNSNQNQSIAINVCRKSVNTQNRMLNTSSEDDNNQTPKSRQGKISTQELKTKKNIIASDHKTNVGITKNNTTHDESIKSVRSSSKLTKYEDSSKSETNTERLPKTPTGNSNKVNRINTSLITDIYNTDDTEDNKCEIYYQYVKARKLYLDLQTQLMGDICDENDTILELSKIRDLHLNNKHSNETNTVSKTSNKQSTNIKPNRPKERRKTIHALESQKSKINESKTENVDEKSANGTNKPRKFMKLELQRLGINKEQMNKGKSMYSEINEFENKSNHCSDTNGVDLGRYQDGNCRKSIRNRRKSMYIERVPLMFSDDTDTAPESDVIVVNKIHTNEASQVTHNHFEVKKTLNIEDKVSLKLPNTNETNLDPRKSENNVHTVYTEKISKTCGSISLNDKEVPEPNHFIVQDTVTKPIKSLRMLKNSKPSKEVSPRSEETECKNECKQNEYVIQDTSNVIPQIGVEDDNSTLIISGNKLDVGIAINDSISITTFSNDQQIGNEETHLDKSDDNLSDSYTSTINKNLKNTEMGLRHMNVQRRIRDSFSSDGEEEEKIVSLEKTVIDNEIKETATTHAIQEKRSPRKRRIVKILSTSLKDDQIDKKINCTPDKLEVTTPASPTFHHPIFNTHVTEKSQSHLNMTPLSTDYRFQEIDSKLRDMFQSPQHETEGNTSTAPQKSVISTQHNDSGSNITIDETVFSNRENDESSLIISGSHDSKSLNSSVSQDQSATKHLSLGTSNYRFEKVSENVVNLFISRKRKRNKRNNNSNQSGSDEHLLNK